MRKNLDLVVSCLGRDYAQVDFSTSAMPSGIEQ